jgi:putative transposase
MCTSGLVCHVLNRSVGRATIFRDAADYAAFANLLLNVGELASVRLLPFCLMPNHWHLVLWSQATAGQFGIELAPRPRGRPK